LETDLVENGRLSELCVISLNKIKELNHNTEAFLSILSISSEEKTSLVDDRQFRDWMVAYMAQKSEILKESNLFKNAIVQNGELAWRLCSLLISSLVEIDNGTEPISTSSTPRNPANMWVLFHNEKIATFPRSFYYKNIMLI
jgi:hypothetical protein